MIEGLILLAELVAVGLLLWTVQRHDTPGARPPTDLFTYRDVGKEPKGSVRKAQIRGNHDA